MRILWSNIATAAIEAEIDRTYGRHDIGRRHQLGQRLAVVYGRHRWAGWPAEW